MAYLGGSIVRVRPGMNGFSNNSGSPGKKTQEEEVVKRKSSSSRSRERPEGDKQSNPRPGRLRTFKDARTNLILKQVFSELCTKDARQVEREIKRLSPEDGKLVERVSGLLVDFIKETDQIPMNLDTFTKQEDWNLHPGTVYMEFSKVASETFKSAINWGRIIMFLGFAVSYTVYLEQDIMVGSADSVLQWTCQVLEEDLGEYIASHGGWEGFADYLETALKATRRSRQKQQLSSTGSDQGGATGDDNRSSVWTGAFAAGAVAVGAMAALTLRQAFS